MTPVGPTLGEAWAGRLRRADRYVFRTLQRLAVDGVATCTFQGISDQTPYVSRSTAIEAVKSLERLGLIEKMEKRQQRFGRSPNSYRLCSVVIEARGEREEVHIGP